jgi:hypothetical protein
MAAVDRPLFGLAMLLTCVSAQYALTVASIAINAMVSD